MTDTEWLDKSEAAWKRVYGDWVPDSLKDVPRLFALARQAVAAEAERDELKRMFDRATPGTPLWEVVYLDILNLRERIDDLEVQLVEANKWRLWCANGHR